MKHCYLIFFTTCILISGCQTEVSKDLNSDYYTIDYEQCVEKEQQMLLSEIADSIEYLELKTPEDIIITNITKLIPFNEDLIICGNDGALKREVYQFLRDGQFVRRIGGMRQNLDEIVVAIDIAIDKKNKEIIIMSLMDIFFYDFDGNYLRSIRTTSNNIGISDSILWIGQWMSVEKKYIATAICCNKKGDTVATISNPFYVAETNDSNSRISSSLPLFYYHNGLLYFKPNESYDTLWQISGANKELYAVINMGKHKLPIENESWYSSVEFDRSSHKYWGINTIAEDNRYFFLRSRTRNPIKQHKFNYIVYDKKKRKGFTVKDDKDLKITDDIMGGPNVWPQWITEKYYISTINRNELQEQIESGGYSPAEPLKSQLSRIGENANQIIILCHRKPH